MSRRSLKLFAAVTGLVLLAGLAFMNWQTNRVEAAASGSAPVMYVQPRLDVHPSYPPGVGPAQANPVPWEVVVGILQNTRSGNSIQNVFQPLNTSSLEIIPLEGSVPFDSVCDLPTGLPDKLMRCRFEPPLISSPCGEPPLPPCCATKPCPWVTPGQIEFVMRLATAEGDVVEGLFRLEINTPEPPPPPPPPPA